MASLNRTSTPQQRGQYQPGPVTQASGGDVTALQDAIDALTVRVEALETQIADHETRITALEP